MAVFYGMGGFLLGFAFPIAAGFFSCSNKDLKKAEFWLKVLFFWVLGNHLVVPLLNAVLEKVSPSLFSFLYTAYPAALVVPKSNVVNTLDELVLKFLDLGSLSLVKTRLEQLCVASRKALFGLYRKLEELTTF